MGEQVNTISLYYFYFSFPACRRESLFMTKKFAVHEGILNRSAVDKDPENPLVCGAGPLVGTPFPTSARSTFTALSPLTGIFGHSNGGGLFGVQVKRAGYDHLVIKGASDKSCYIFVGPNGL
jgi:aldehyde:ferredoxin oxidoreductase